MSGDNKPDFEERAKEYLYKTGPPIPNIGRDDIELLVMMFKETYAMGLLDGRDEAMEEEEEEEDGGKPDFEELAIRLLDQIDDASNISNSPALINIAERGRVAATLERMYERGHEAGQEEGEEDEDQPIAVVGHIFNTVSDLVADFLYYDRKEDEDLPMNAIQEAIGDGLITVDDILEHFTGALLSGLKAGR